jgi:NAD(P)H-dependent flavin oxidoreductase YrpB (nitropropane dioxygenase family)
MCAVMNQVSDLNLALAVHAAGAMPSLQINRYNQDNTINHDLVNRELKEFTKQAGNSNLVLVVADEDFFDYQFIKLICQYQISHVEILSNEINGSHHRYKSAFHLGIQYVKKTTKILSRIMNHTSTNLYPDAFCVKGKESAGFAGAVSVSDLFEQQRSVSNTALIPYGGVGTPAQVKQYMDRGAAGVAVGTLFAATQESCLSHETKLAMCNASLSQITQFKETGQNALVLGELKSTKEDWNHEHDLKNGIAGQGGLVYAGTAIDHVTHIRTAQEVVDYLTSEL